MTELFNNPYMNEYAFNQKLIPVNTAGCYIPGGRYAHISSATMAITPAKVAGVKTINCASPPKDKNGAHPGII